jgi:hypothetical protein
MVAYAVVLVLLTGAYASLVFVGPGLALAFALAALIAMLVSLALVILK